MDGIIIRNNIRKVHGKSTFPLDDGDSTAFANFLPQRQDLCFMCYVEANVYAEDLPSWSSFFFIIGYFERTFETSKEAQQVVDAFWLRSGRESEVDGIYFRPWIPFMQTDMRVKAKMLIVKPQFGFLKRDNKKRALAWNPEDTDHYACDFWMPSVNPARIPHQVTNLRQLLQYFGMTPVVRTKTLRHLMDVSNSKINAAKFGLKIAIRFSIGTLARGILNLRRKIPKRDQ
jgi:hypothetical protein